jgi:hypothetical protein
VHRTCDLITICANQIHAAPFARPQVIGQPATISIDGSQSQAKLNLEIRPALSERMPTRCRPTLGGVGVFHVPDAIHRIHKAAALFVKRFTPLRLRLAEG